MHAFEIVLEDPGAWHPVGHNGAQLGRLAGLRCCPSDGQVAAPVGILGQVDVGEIAALAGWDAELVKRDLTAVGKGDQRGVGQTDHIAPAKCDTEFGPFPSTKPTICEEGHTPRLPEQVSHIPEHAFTHGDLNIAFARDYLPGQGQRAVAVRERQAEHLERLVANEAAIEHDRHLAPAPRCQDVTDDRVIERTRLDGRIGQPAPDPGDAPDFLRRPRDMEGDLAQVYRVALHQADDNPHPVGQPAPMQGGMDGLQLRGDLRVYFLAAAHRVAPYQGV